MLNRAKVTGTLVLVFLALGCGVLLIALGIGETVDYQRATAGYAVTEGQLIAYQPMEAARYDPAKKKHIAATYVLVYGYAVDGREYQVATDYSTSALPALGNTREIHYNPQNPGEAVIRGPNRHTALFFIGALFIAVPLVMGLALLQQLRGKARRPSSVDWLGLIVGLVFVAFGWGALFMITGEWGPVGIWRYYTTSFHPMLLIPPLLVLVGVLQTVKWVRLTVRPPKDRNAH